MHGVGGTENAGLEFGRS